MKEHFPEFQTCMHLMRKKDARSQEEGFALLLPHAQEYFEQLMDEFSQETDPGLRCWLLELIARAKDPRAFSLFLTYLQSGEMNLKTWAVYGLQLLDTKEARHALWKAGVYYDYSFR